MKFTPREDIKKSGQIFEAGNTYDSAKYSFVDDLDINRWYEAGFCGVEGKTDKPRRDPITDMSMAVDNTTVKSGG